MSAVRFHPAAAAELTAAARYYEGQQTGLGKRFLMSVQDAVNRIVANPGLYQIVEPNVRRCLTRTFPFGVLFRRRPGKIVIIAVMHLHRDPGYWKNR
ncbi:MAG TPA: type II toxin-antitoxin system RelE/ParE family toxin [bacterium]|nr:type II toxin-antitoxin system RelE/ParE family toxin [bacterium]